MFLTGQTAEACWRCGASDDASMPAREYVVPQASFTPPPIVIYAQPHYYSPLNYGAIRYNRPCQVSDGRYSYAVACTSLENAGLIRSYDGW